LVASQQVMQYVHVKLNLGLPWKKQRSTKKGSFHQQIGNKCEETSSERLHLENIFVWC